MIMFVNLHFIINYKFTEDTSSLSTNFSQITGRMQDSGKNVFILEFAETVRKNEQVV